MQINEINKNRMFRLQKQINRFKVVVKLQFLVYNKTPVWPQSQSPIIELLKMYDKVPYIMLKSLASLSMSLQKRQWHKTLQQLPHRDQEFES